MASFLSFHSLSDELEQVIFFLPLIRVSHFPILGTISFSHI